jgi:hypothetical protein
MSKPNRRQPVSVNRYLAIHQGKMNAMYADGIIKSDDLVFEFADDPVVTLIGTVRFGTKVALRVKKFMLIEWHDRSDCLVTKRYSYQCHIVGQSKSEIFRYDNYHDDQPHEGHAGPHHVHIFDPPGREVLGSPFEMKEEDRPLMDEIIREAHRHSVAYAKQHKRKSK